MESVEMDVRPSKVTIKQFRRNAWLPEGHDGEYRYTGTAEYLTVQADRKTGMLVTGLTTDDEKRLVEKLNLIGNTPNMPQSTLSKYNKDFWGRFRIRIPKEGKILDIENNPMDELEWLVLKAHQNVANSEAEKLYTPFARYVLTSAEEEAVEVNKQVEVKSEAYSEYAKMSLKDKINFLKVYGRNPGKDPKESFVVAAVGKILEDDPKDFLRVMKDSNFKVKLFINQCVDVNILRRQGTRYLLPGGDVIGYSLDKAIEYLKDSSNNEVKMTLMGQLQEITGDK